MREFMEIKNPAGTVVLDDDTGEVVGGTDVPAVLLGPVTADEIDAMSHVPKFIRPVFAKDIARLTKEIKDEIAANKRRTQWQHENNITQFKDEGHEFLTMQLFNKILDFVRYHGMWSLQVIAKNLGLPNDSFYYYCRRYPKAQEEFELAREEFRSLVAQGTLQRIFALLDNPRTDARTKGALLETLAEKFHVDMKPTPTTSAPTNQDNRIQIVVQNHAAPPPVEPPPPRPEITIDVAKAEQVAKDKGEALGLALFSSKPPKR